MSGCKHDCDHDCDRGFGFGGGFAFIVVLFILLIIVGASCFGGGDLCCPAPVHGYGGFC
ncbi:YjcZ family sporulation protein [Peribacillus frigoritolerans]|nr:YjcZ family sporulation protein [Peribacillus frigoritolerans]MDF1997607.1 YjcZ family sporulation protein [Peribacillus frigoritolerans]